MSSGKTVNQTIKIQEMNNNMNFMENPWETCEPDD